MNYSSRHLTTTTYLHIDIPMFLLIVALIIYSIIIIWSASGQDLDLMIQKLIQIIIGFIIMIIMAQISPRTYNNMAPYLYIFCIILLIFVHAFGQITKGAQRWLNLGFISFQPSEIAKIIIPLMVSHVVNHDLYPPTIKNTLLSLILIFLPTSLIAIQPDLGTSVLVATAGLFILYLSGINWKFIIIVTMIIICCTPVLWFFLMHDYQRERIMILINPNTTDSLRSGYHIIQSKIAIGSGGLFGKGWLYGSQSKLEFLPERHTDFIFAVLAEEFGLIGVIILLVLYLLLIIRGLIIASNTQNTFNRVMVGGLILILFICIFVNIGMVSGILPIVGVPLPLISYGGSALIVSMAGFGIIMSIHTHHKFISKNL